jgi:hypothetical protein
MKKRIYLSFFFICIVLTALYFQTYRLDGYIKFTRYLPIYNLKHFPPKVIFYSSLTPEYLSEYAGQLKNDYGIDGFIITSLPSVKWPGNINKLTPLTDIVYKGNKTAAVNGIKDNFLKIGLEQGNIGLWEDEIKWQKDLKELKKVAAWAKKTGFKGIALDTETYRKTIWHNGLPRNDLPNIKELIKKRGLQTMQAILTSFPEAEIIVLPVGHLFAYTKTKPNKYAYWIDFFNGLLNAKPENGVTLFSERTYKVPIQIKLKNYYKDIRGEIIADHVDDPNYWLTKCSIALGMWPLGREYTDKRANLNPQEFYNQFNTAMQYCPKYVWVYAQGLSWWQTAKGQKYGLNSKEANLLTVKNIKKYQKILKDAKDPNLKLFYRSIKYHRHFTYLDLFFEKLFGVN